MQVMIIFVVIFMLFGMVFTLLFGRSFDNILISIIRKKLVYKIMYGMQYVSARQIFTFYHANNGTSKDIQMNQSVLERSLTGIYKRQLSLTANIVYEICFRVKSQRQFGRVIIKYTAENLFNIQHADIKVPTNLLKQGDFKRAYEDAQRLFTVTQKFTDLQKVRKQTQSQVFVQTTQINTRLVYISIAEIAIILVAGLYQFYSLRTFLAGKQYI